MHDCPCCGEAVYSGDAAELCSCCKQAGCEMSKADLVALLAFASKDETRRHLCGVYFDPSNGRAVATNGHVLAIAKNCGTFDAPPFILGRDALQRAAKVCGSGMMIEIVAPAGDEPKPAAVVRVTVDRCAGGPGPVETVACVDATFPPVDAVVPSLGQYGAEDARSAGEPLPNHTTGDEQPTARCAPVMGFDAEYLALLALPRKAIGGRSMGVALRLPTDALSPAVATCESHETRWTMVVMPMRV